LWKEDFGIESGAVPVGLLTALDARAEFRGVGSRRSMSHGIMLHEDDCYRGSVGIHLNYRGQEHGGQKSIHIIPPIHNLLGLSQCDFHLL